MYDAAPNHVLRVRSRSCVRSETIAASRIRRPGRREVFLLSKTCCSRRFSDLCVNSTPFPFPLIYRVSTPGVSSQLARARACLPRGCAGPGGNARSAAWLAAAGAGPWAPCLWEKAPLNRPWYLDFGKRGNGPAQNLGLTRPIGDTYRTREAKPRNPAAEFGVRCPPGPTGGAALGEAHSSA